MTEAKRTLGYDLCDWVDIVDRRLESFRYYGFRKATYEGMPLAILLFQKATEYGGPPDKYWSNPGPSFHVFQIRREALSEKERAEISGRILNDVVEQSRRREKLPATAKFKRSGVLYTLADDLRTYPLQGR